MHGHAAGRGLRDLCDPDRRRRAGHADPGGDHLDRHGAALSKGGITGSTDAGHLRPARPLPAQRSALWRPAPGLFAIVPGPALRALPDRRRSRHLAFARVPGNMRKAKERGREAAERLTEAARKKLDGRRARPRRDPCGVRPRPGAGGHGRGDRPRRAHRQHAQPHRDDGFGHDHSRDPADRQRRCSPRATTRSASRGWSMARARLEADRVLALLPARPPGTGRARRCARAGLWRAGGWIAPEGQEEARARRDSR
jgi:hypothetical protein